jgi:hypothetical protein
MEWKSLEVVVPSDLRRCWRELEGGGRQQALSLCYQLGPPGGQAAKQSKGARKGNPREIGRPEDLRGQAANPGRARESKPFCRYTLSCSLCVNDTKGGLRNIQVEAKFQVIKQTSSRLQSSHSQTKAETMGMLEGSSECIYVFLYLS